LAKSHQYSVSAEIEKEGFLIKMHAAEISTQQGKSQSKALL